LDTPVINSNRGPVSNSSGADDGGGLDCRARVGVCAELDDSGAERAVGKTISVPNTPDAANVVPSLIVMNAVGAERATHH
jgi:hypothetical protein